VYTRCTHRSWASFLRRLWKKDGSYKIPCGDRSSLLPRAQRCDADAEVQLYLYSRRYIVRIVLKYGAILNLVLYFLPLVLELFVEFLAIAWRFGSLVVLPAQVPLVKVSSPALNVKYPPVFVSWPKSEVYST
jgi:hypothetical protein